MEKYGDELMQLKNELKRLLEWFAGEGFIEGRGFAELRRRNGEMKSGGFLVLAYEFPTAHDMGD